MSSVRLFKLAYYSELHRRPLLVPKQAAVIGDFVGLGWEEAARKVTEIFLDALDDEAVEQLGELKVTRMHLGCKREVSRTAKLTSQELEGTSVTVLMDGADRLRSLEFDLPHAPPKRRRMEDIERVEMACTVCGVVPPPSTAMVAMQCNHAFCEPCLSSRLGCACDCPPGQRWLKTCGCNCACPVCDAKLRWVNITAVREPSSTPENSPWQFLKRVKKCECARAVQPTFGLPGQKKDQARWCQFCPDKPQEAVDLTFKYCECGRGLCMMGLPGEERKAARWCRECPDRPPEAVMVIWKRCECGHSEPNFGLFGQPRRMARWCSSCPNKPPDAVDIVHKRCKCGHHRPSMGMPGDKRKDAKWCLKCPTLPKAAVNVLNKMCECGKSRPVFVLPGQTKRDVKWCRQCPDRPEEAIDVISKKCMCGKKQPYFGFPWEKAGEARWCSDCPDRPPMAINVKIKRCLCGRHEAIMGLPGQVRKWCNECPTKPPEAVNLVTQKCECGLHTACMGIPGVRINGRVANWCRSCPNKPPSAVYTSLKSPYRPITGRRRKSPEK